MSPEERAKELLRGPVVSCIGHYQAIRAIAEEFRAARREALQEAARVADCYDDRAARDIRALIEKEPEA